MTAQDNLAASDHRNFGTGLIDMVIRSNYPAHFEGDVNRAKGQTTRPDERSAYPEIGRLVWLYSTVCASSGLKPPVARDLHHLIAQQPGP